MFYYIEVHLLDHYIQLIKVHGETVKKLYYLVSCINTPVLHRSTYFIKHTMYSIISDTDFHVFDKIGSSCFHTELKFQQL
jgi:hypothetical protein